MQKEKSGNNIAVVIGAGIAGLLAARVLADKFKRVTVLDQDHLPLQPSERKYALQSKQIHVMLARGQQVMEQLFPGFESALEQSGAPLIEFGKNVMFISRGGRIADFEPAIAVRSCSRALLEWSIRNALSKLPNVEIRDRIEIVGLIRGTGNFISGVYYRAQDAVEQWQEEEKTINADFVIDASGRNSKVPDWLEKIGIERPKETAVNPHLGYTTRIYKNVKPDSNSWKGLYIQQAPPTHLRGGIIIPIEGDKWMVGLVGTGGEYPPPEDKEWLEYAKSLRDPALYNAVVHAEPVSEIEVYMNIKNAITHYEKVALPSNFAVIGDAVCCLNPVYGQGMTIASLEALELGEWLASPHGGLSDKSKMDSSVFQKQIAKLVNPIWEMTVIEDLRSPKAEYSGSIITMRAMQIYLDSVFSCSTRDQHIARTLYEVFHLLKPETSLVSPEMISRLAATRILQKGQQDANK